MKRIGVLLVAGLVACRPGPPAPPRQTSMDLAISNATLANGLRVVLVRDPHATDLQVTMRYNVGSVDDPKDQSGVAHLVEHLMFQQVLGNESIFAKLEATTRFFNAMTSPDATTYLARAPIDRLESLLSIEAVRLGFRCTSITPATFEREREVVVNEERLRARGELLWTALHRGVFSDAHPYARRSTPESVGAITMAQACAFADAHYTPTNAVLVVSGDLRETAVVDAMAKFIARLPRRDAAPAPAVPVAERRTGEATAPLDDDAVLVAWPVPVDPVRRVRAEAVFTTVLGAIDANVKGIVLPLSLGDQRAKMFGALIYRTSKETTESVRAAVKAAVSGAPLAFSVGGRYGKFVFNRVQQRALFEAFSSFDDAWKRDAMIAAHVLAGRDPKLVLGTELRSLGTLTRDAAAQVVREVFAFERASIIALTADTQTRGGTRRPIATPVHDIGIHRDAPDPADAHQPAPERIAVTTPAAIMRTLPNGLRVVLLPVTSVPTVDARIVFSAGSADDPATKHGAAAVAAYALRWNGRDFGKVIALAESGGSTDVEVTPDHVVFSARGLDMHLDYLLTGLRKLVVDGDYGGGATLMVRALNRGVKRLDDEDTLADAYRAARYGADHPYAASSRHPSPTLSVADARAFRGTYFTPANATLVISGRFDAALANRWIDHLYADWSGKVPLRDAPFASVQPVALAKEDAISEVQISMTLPATGGGRAERLVAAEMLDEIVGDVRHQLGAAYAIDASYDDRRLASSYRVDGATDAARTHEAIALVRDRLAQLRRDPDATARAFVTARRRVLASLASTTGTAASLAARVTSDLSLGRELLSEGKLAADVQMLTIERMPAALGDLDLARAAILLRGPTADVDRAFAVLGRTPQHLAATDRSDDDSPFDDLDDDRELEDTLVDTTPPAKLAASLLPGYAFGGVNGEAVSGPVLSAQLGVRVDRRVTVGFLASVGKLTGPNETSVTPVVGALSVQADLGRLWGAGLVGLRVEDAAHPMIIGSRWYKTIELGAEVGAVVLRSGPHQLSAFARYEHGLGSEIGLSPTTLGVGYRLY